MASSSIIWYCSAVPVKYCPGSAGFSVLATPQAISNVCRVQLCFGLPTLRVGGRISLLFLSVACFIGSASGSRMRCPSSETALCWMICKKVSSLIILPFLATAFSAASSTDLLVADLSMCDARIPRIRISPLCWKASSLRWSWFIGVIPLRRGFSLRPPR